MTTALTNIMGSLGRHGDDMVGHLSHGDVVIPRAIVLQNPEFLTKFKKVMEDNQADYRTHVAGSGYENKNPHTGASEFFFNGVKSFFQKAAQNPMATLGSIALAPLIGGASLGAGALYLSQQPRQGSGDLQGGTNATPTAAMPAPNLPTAVTQPFTPKQPAAATQPFGLFNSSPGGQQFSTLDPMQQRSYLATQGSQGGGIGDESKNYYLNLLQRNLIDEHGQQQNINSALLPVERNYLSTLGLPTGSTGDLLQALQT